MTSVRVSIRSSRAPANAVLELLRQRRERFQDRQGHRRDRLAVGIPGVDPHGPRYWLVFCEGRAQARALRRREQVAEHAAEDRANGRREHVTGPRGRTRHADAAGQLALIRDDEFRGGFGAKRRPRRLDLLAEGDVVGRPLLKLRHRRRLRIHALRARTASLPTASRTVHGGRRQGQRQRQSGGGKRPNFHLTWIRTTDDSRTTASLYRDWTPEVEDT